MEKTNHLFDVIESDERENMDKQKKIKRGTAAGLRSLSTVEQDIQHLQECQAYRERSLKELVLYLVNNINSQPAFTLVSNFYLRANHTFDTDTQF